MEYEQGRICPDCFQKSFRQGKCQNCGFLMQEEHPLRLPLFTRLKQRYLVGRLIGHGGFGMTYKVYDTIGAKICAVKEFVPLGLVNRMEGKTQIYVTSLENESDFAHGKKRFMDEAKILKQLQGLPETVYVEDYFEENNTVYFVMEYIQGVSLLKLTKAYGGCIPYHMAQSLICRVGNCLEQVHSRGHIFHRDISPDNIMVTQEGEIRLIDFGNAKYLIGSKSQTLSPVLKHGYAPPEQYSSSGKQGSFTDVYALAATFYYIVTGNKVPPSPERFGGRDYIPLQTFNPEIPIYVSEAVDHALNLNSKLRTQTAAEFVRALEGGLQGQAVSYGNPYVKLKIPGNEVKWNLPVDQIVVIGRSRKVAQIILSKDDRVSKRHCELYYDSILRCFCLVDVSTNGTFAGGKRLEKGKVYILQKGEKFVIGRNIYVMEVGVENDF